MNLLFIVILLLGLRFNFAKGLRCYSCKDLEASEDKIQQFKFGFLDSGPDCRLDHTPNAKDVQDCKGNFCEVELFEDSLGHKLTVRQCGAANENLDNQHKACEIEVNKPANAKDVNIRIKMALKLFRSKSFNFTRLTCSSDMCTPALDDCTNNGSILGQAASPLLSTILFIFVLIKSYQ